MSTEIIDLFSAFNLAEYAQVCCDEGYVHQTSKMHDELWRTSIENH